MKARQGRERADTTTEEGGQNFRVKVASASCAVFKISRLLRFWGICRVAAAVRGLSCTLLGATALAAARSLSHLWPLTRHGRLEIKALFK